MYCKCTHFKDDGTIDKYAVWRVEDDELILIGFSNPLDGETQWSDIIKFSDISQWICFRDENIESIVSSSHTWDILTEREAFVELL